MNSIWTQKQSKLLVVLTLIISLVGLVGCSDDDSGPKKYNLSGTVVSNDGQALAGITVVVEGGDAQTATNLNGEWSLTKVEEGKVIKAVNTDTYTFNGNHEVTADNSNLEFKANENKPVPDNGDDGSNDDGEEDQKEEVTIEVVDETTIKVRFSSGGEKEYEVEELKHGDNQVTFEYNGETYTETVSYSDPGVEKVELVSYRHLKVTYNTLVDTKTAGELDNYYLNINEGNAAYNSIDLGISNRLSELVDSTNIEINVEDQDEQTIVDIYLSEDARFTNELDQELEEDDERTLELKYAGAENDNKKLVKGAQIEFAVRNVATRDGKLSMDTTVHDVTIEDEDNPRCESLILSSDYETANAGTEIAFDGAVDRVVPSAENAGNNVELNFDEPVFDAHDLERGTEELKNVRVYVNNTEVASTTKIDNNGDDLTAALADVMKFNMQAEDDYAAASQATLKVRALLEAYEDEADLDEGSVYQVGKSYTISLTGVRDLAGNNMERSEIGFTINLVDDNPEEDPGEEDRGKEPVIYDTLPPKVEEVQQVADNIFRIKFVTASDDNYEGDEIPGQPLEDVTATFILEGANYDEGTIERNVPLSNEDGYSYVQVPAIDQEDEDGENVLSYGENNSIERDITIANPWRIGKADINDDDTREDNVFVHEGASKKLDNFLIEKDIYAPVHDPFASDNSYYLRDAVDSFEKEGKPGDKDDRTIVFEVKDVRPDTIAASNHFKNPVVPVRYEYDADQKKIKPNTTVSLDDESGIFLPITVSYEKDGITHEAVVTNKDLVDNKSKNDERNEIQFITYQDDNGVNRYKLKIDLTDYKGLLDNNQRLVDNVTYKVEVPEGFFADAPRDVVFDTDQEEGAYGDYVGEDEVTATDYLSFEDNNYQETFNEDVGFTAPTFIGDDLAALGQDDVRKTQYDENTEDYNDIYDVEFVANERPEVNYGFTSEAFDFSFSIPKDHIPDEEDGDDGREGRDPRDDDADNPEDEVPQTTKRLVEYNDEKNQIMVKFTGGIDASTLKDPNNYTISGQTLAQLGMSSQDIEYLVEDIGDTESGESDDSDGQFSIAAFVVPEGTIKTDGVNVNFTVSGVANNYGGTMTPLRTQLELLDNTQPEPTCDLIGDQEIRLDFAEEVNYREDANKETAAANFIVLYDDQQIRVDQAEIIDAPADKITLHFDSIMYDDENLSVDEIDTDKLAVKVVKNSNDSMLIIDDAKLKNPLKTGEYSVTKN